MVWLKANQSRQIMIMEKLLQALPQRFIQVMRETTMREIMAIGKMLIGDMPSTWDRVRLVYSKRNHKKYFNTKF
jgi:hypothetical protein